MSRPRIVLANGVFDLYHYGHCLYLEAAAKMGDLLIVSVTKDAFVNKGPNRPMFPEAKRLAVIKSVRWVHDAILVSDPMEAFSLVHPHVFVKGADYRDTIQPEHRAYCEANGIEIRFTDTPMYSATRIIHDRFAGG